MPLTLNPCHCGYTTIWLISDEIDGDKAYWCRCMECGDEGKKCKTRDDAVKDWNRDCNCPECDRLARLDK